MKTKFKLLRLIFLLTLVISCEHDADIGIDKELTNDVLEKAYKDVTTQKRQPAPAAIIKNNSKKVYVHYMPWFLNLEQDGFWGQHWTMTNKNPNVMDAYGKREIASHYYPLIGPYSSNDNDLQEYHLLLMKLSGIDGVIFDWYSSRDANDYNALKTSTESFIKEIEDVGLEFAIMYEDKTAQYNATKDEGRSIINNAVVDLQYIQDTYFTSENYIKINDSELLFLFGPNYITNPLDWEIIIPKLNSTPYFMSLWEASDRLGQYAGG
jgi:glycoprotein endo-alpha-1,2-mannosidase